MFCLAKIQRSRMDFSIWYSLFPLTKNRFSRSGEISTSAGGPYLPARALSIADSLISVANICIGTLAPEDSKTSVRQIAIE